MRGLNKCGHAFSTSVRVQSPFRSERDVVFDRIRPHIVRVVQNGKCAALRRLGRLNRTQRLFRQARHRSAILTVFLSFSAAVSWCAPPKPRKTSFWLFSNLFLNLTKVVQNSVSSRLFETCALGQACVGDTVSDEE